MEIWAHRGWSAAYPENTLPAFEAAVRAGATGVEFDVQLTADGVPVIMHDDKVDRTTDGHGRVDRRTWSEIQRLDAGAWFDEQFRGTRVPSLAETLVFFRDDAPGVLLNVELKSVRRQRELLVRRTWEMIRSSRLVERTVISSFDTGLLQMLRQLAPHARVALLTTRWGWRSARTAAVLSAAAVHLDAAAASADVVRMLHTEDCRVRVYTVNDLATFRRVAAAGVDGVFTDHVDLLLDAHADPAQTAHGV